MGPGLLRALSAAFLVLVSFMTQDRVVVEPCQNRENNRGIAFSCAASGLVPDRMDAGEKDVAWLRHKRPAAIAIGRAQFSESEGTRQKFGDRARNVNCNPGWAGRREPARPLPASARSAPRAADTSIIDTPAPTVRDAYREDGACPVNSPVEGRRRFGYVAVGRVVMLRTSSGSVPAGTRSSAG